MRLADRVGGFKEELEVELRKAVAMTDSQLLKQWERVAGGRRQPTLQGRSSRSGERNEPPVRRP